MTPVTEAPPRPVARRPATPVRRPRLPGEKTAHTLRTKTASTAPAGSDAWPHTTRLLPWMVAGFLAVLWLVPINAIELDVPFPIDLKFDRIVLPPIVLIWILAIAMGGKHAPRLKATGIHVAVGAFVGLCFLSVVFHADMLNQTLELPVALKKLSLIVSYALVFAIVASVVRREEVQAFLVFTLVLACLLAIGIIYEYHYHYNVFYQWSARVLPGIFTVDYWSSARFDAIGRPETRGPADLGLEAAAMLAMALPVALVGLMHATRWRNRILYMLATGLLLAAATSTFRKTAFMAPISVILTLAFFRRRELLRLSPLGLVLIAMIHVLSPGALGGITGQLHGSNLAGANTVNDRTADYDGVRPDVLSHLAFGRGYGSYEQTRYRILDSEILHRLVEMGVIGLVAYLAMAMTVVGAMRPLIRDRMPERAPPALIAACVAVVFLVVSTLFDVLSFPQTPYIFLVFAGFGAALLTPPPWQREAAR